MTTIEAVESKPAIEAAHQHRRSGTRETVESIVLAFILAFLFRSFEAEAFVIPTGSMAPTLMGRHKDLICPNCGFAWQANASDEVDSRTGARLPEIDVLGCTCPNCRFTIDIGPPEPGEPPLEPSYSGDRIIASKLPLSLDPPRRFEIMVFRFPEESQTNYIKRLVGLPGETIHIWHGDLYAGAGEVAEAKILRKPHDVVEATLQSVYDNDYASDYLLERGWPPRWQAEVPGAGAIDASHGWTSSDGTRSFAIDGQAGDLRWLRYRHIVPSFEDWMTIENPTARETMRTPRPQLITDFTGYNASYSDDPERETFADDSLAPDVSSLGLHWVSDLAIDCTLESRSDSGTAIVELVEGGARLQCRFDLSMGTATLAIDQLPDFRATAETPLRGRGTWQVRLANVDDALTLWIDGRPVEFDAPTTFALPHAELPTAADLAPVGVGSQGASIAVSHLRVLRDIYYIANDQSGGSRFSALSDYPATCSLTGATRRELADFMSTPSRWSELSKRREARFTLAADQFFLLGDNSPRSQDGRLWTQGHFVDRDLLVGRALFVYWPHAWETPYSLPVNAFGREFSLPFYPNFRRMGAIR